MKQATKFTLQRGWKLLIADLGINPSHVLSFAGLPADLFSRQHASLSAADFYNLWRGLEQAAGSDELALKIGQAISIEAFDPSIFACLCSPDLNTATQRLAGYKRLVAPITLEVEIDEDQTRLTLSCYGHDGRIPCSLGAVELVFITQLARLATRQNMIPISVELTQLPTPLPPYEHFFGVKPSSSEHNRIAFSAPDARRPFLTEDAAMWDFFEIGLKKKLTDLDAETDASQRVRSALLEMLPCGQSSIEETAGRLAMSKRSLQRHLRRESSSYQGILNSTRKELAMHYLERSDIPHGEISFLLGFQDCNSFLRAFKSWTGTTSGDYRSARLFSR